MVIFPLQSPQVPSPTSHQVAHNVSPLKGVILRSLCINAPPLNIHGLSSRPPYKKPHYPYTEHCADCTVFRTLYLYSPPSPGSAGPRAAPLCAKLKVNINSSLIFGRSSPNRRTMFTGNKFLARDLHLISAANYFRLTWRGDVHSRIDGLNINHRWSCTHHGWV